MNIKLTLLPGDGIGPEVTAAAVKVLQLAADRFNFSVKTETCSFGGQSIDEYGVPLTEETLQKCLDSDSVFLGAVGGPKWEDLEQQRKPEAGLLKIRKELGLFANIRPAKIYQALIDSSTLKKEVLQDTDFIVLRELTGGIYFGNPRGYTLNKTDSAERHRQEKGWNTMVYTRKEVERIARRGFEMARGRRGKLTSVDKANVLDVSQFWREIVIELHKDYPQVELTHLYVDNAAMQIVREPSQFDVILTGNLFGDILSDIAGMITGSLGMLPSASIGKQHALYEPVHGSAPDIAGENKANPIAAIASMAMLLEHSFEMKKAADVINDAIERTLAQGYRTADIFSEGMRLAGTTEITERIMENFEEIFNEQALGVFTL